VQQQPVYTNQQPVVYNAPPPVQQGYPPYVNISYPQNNFSSPGNYVTVQANIQNIQNAQQVSISQNGYPVKYFAYDSYSGNLSFQTFLQTGANNMIIAANNPFGTGSQGVTVFYNPPYIPNTNNPAVINSDPGNPPGNSQPMPHTSLTVKKPIVQYSTPAVSPEEVTSPSFNVSASIQNISGANQLSITFNGSNVSQFNYNPAAKSVDFNVTLLTGYNSVTISASNVAGTDSKSTVIDYKPVGRPPRIEIFNPATSPFTSASSNMIVSGYVYNVSSAADITVVYDGNPLTFHYNNATHEIEIPVTLYKSSNQLQITAANTFGNDVKQVTLLLLALISPHAATSSTFTLQAQQPAAPLSINGTAQQPGNSTENGPKTGTNTGVGGHHNKPLFTLISPGVNPYTSLSGVISVSANLDYVQNANDVSVSYNGAPVSFSYDPVAGEHLGFTSPLKPGSNIFVVKASNLFGSVSESIEVNYTPTNTNGNVNGNPALHFSGGSNVTANTPNVFTAAPVTTAPAHAAPAPANTPRIQQPQTNPGKPLKQR
jgi:hypothetical protein